MPIAPGSRVHDDNSECAGGGKLLGGGLREGFGLARRQSSFAVTSIPASIPADPRDNPTLP